VTYNMIDTYECSKVVTSLPQLKAAGIHAAGMYYFHASAFKQLLTKAVAQAVSGAGLYVVSIWESGYPTSGGYFGSESGHADGTGALIRAQEAGQPADSPIYATVDYDATQSDLDGITAYFQAFAAALGNSYTVGVYGSGMVCQHLINLCLVKKTWLAESTGFAGYQSWLSHADIVQIKSARVFGMDVDTNRTSGSAGGWQLG
jgi:hypothetical protein